MFNYTTTACALLCVLHMGSDCFAQERVSCVIISSVLCNQLLLLLAH